MQSIPTNGAVYVKHIAFDINRSPEHFLIIANAGKGAGANKNVEMNTQSDAVVYKWLNGEFVAYQKITFDNTVTQFLPVLVCTNYIYRSGSVFMATFSLV